MLATRQMTVWMEPEVFIESSQGRMTNLKWAEGEIKRLKTLDIFAKVCKEKDGRGSRIAVFVND